MPYINYCERGECTAEDCEEQKACIGYAPSHTRGCLNKFSTGECSSDHAQHIAYRNSVTLGGDGIVKP